MTETALQITADLDIQFIGLKRDLLDAWEMRNTTSNGIEFIEEQNPVQRALNSSNYIYSLDPENLALLKALYSVYGEGTDSLLSYASKILKGHNPLK